MFYFESQVIKSGLFIGLHEIYGNEYKDFMSKKLVLVAGDITRHNLGVQIIYDRYSHKLDIIISVAATTTFDERFWNPTDFSHAFYFKYVLLLDLFCKFVFEIIKMSISVF